MLLCTLPLAIPNSGAFPAMDFASLPQLSQMYWDGNSFDSLPASLGDASSLVSLSFDINAITGAFPAGLCRIAGLIDCRVGADTNCSVYQGCYPWVVQAASPGNEYACPLPPGCSRCDSSKSPLKCK